MSKKDNKIRAKLIVNPGAGDASKLEENLKNILRYLKEGGLKVDVAYAAPKKEAIPIARKAAKDGYDIVIAMGGDGTISAVIRGLARSKAHLGIIAGGTMNDIAKSLRIPEDLREACALIASNEARKMDLGLAKTRKRKKFYFFHVTAIGLTATLYPKIKKIPKGKLAQLDDAVRTALKFESKPEVFLTMDDESKVKVDTMLVTVANMPLIGARNLVAPQANPEDGLLDIAVYPDFTKAELLAYFAKTTNEGNPDNDKIRRFRVKKIKVKSTPKLLVAADGIKLGKGKARIKILPGALRVIAPEPIPYEPADTEPAKG
jgi:diacylglycerol kinase (ATP)